MKFAEWLQQQLTERGWTAYDLAANAKARGYTLEPGLIYRILNHETEGGINTVIAIAHGLHLPRKDVFIVRGWLPAEISSEELTVSDPDLQTFVQDALALPANIRQPLVNAANALVRAVKEARGNEDKQNKAIDDLQESIAWITVEEAAQKSGYSTRMIQRLLQEQKVLGKKRGYQWFTTLKSVTKYKAQARPGRPNRG